MTGTTTFLDLTTYSATTDSSALFLNFRTDVAGSTSSSNMNRLDVFATGINASVIALQAEHGVYSISGSYAAANDYGATSTSLLAYETNQMITLQLDTENDGTLDLRINALASITLQKVDDNGDKTSMEAGDLKKNREYLFRYDGTDFVLAGATVADQLSVLGTANNITMISGCNILIDSGVQISDGSRVSGSYIASLGSNDNLLRHIDGSATDSGVIVSSGSRVSGSYIASLGSTDNLLRHFDGSAIDSGVIVSSGSRVSGSYIASLGSANNLLRHIDGSATDSGILASSGSRISGSYVASLGSENNLLRHIDGSAIDSGIIVSSGSRVSGSFIASLGSNDNLLRHIDGSATDSGIIVSSGSRVSGSYIKSGSTLSIVSGSLGLSESGISSGSYNQVEVDVYGRVITGSVVRLRHTVGVQVTAPLQDVTTGSGKAYLPIPTDYDGMNLVDAEASVSTQSTSGLPTVQVYNLTDTVDMLSTEITIDENEYTSYTADTPSVIDAAHDDVAEGDMLRIDVDVAGTGTKGLTVLLSFEEP